MNTFSLISNTHVNKLCHIISDSELQFNVVMVGNSCVGKTSFIRRFNEGQYTEDYRSTIGECCDGEEGLLITEEKKYNQLTMNLNYNKLT